MAGTKRSRQQLVQQIAGQGLQRWATAAVVLHKAVAEWLGLPPTDRQCLDLLHEHGDMTGSELAALTGLTTGAITGAVARLERAGFLRREPHPSDGRKQTLSPVPERVAEVHGALHSLHAEAAALLKDFDARQLAAIASFLEGSSELAMRHALRLRGEAAAPGGGREHH